MSDGERQLEEALLPFVEKGETWCIQQGLHREWREAKKTLGPKKHVLGCDEYHQHCAPKCCRETCWCRKSSR